MPTHCISRLRPYECYKSTLLTSFFKTIDLLAEYPNTLGIIAADQVVNDDKSLNAAPVIKAVVADLKRYMKLQNEINQQRILPAAYDAMSYSSRDMILLDYLTTGDLSSCIDFWSVSFFDGLALRIMAKSSVQKIFLERGSDNVSNANKGLRTYHPGLLAFLTPDSWTDLEMLPFRYSFQNTVMERMSLGNGKSSQFSSQPQSSVSSLEFAFISSTS